MNAEPSTEAVQLAEECDAAFAKEKLPEILERVRAYKEAACPKCGHVGAAAAELIQAAPRVTTEADPATHAFWLRDIASSIRHWMEWDTKHRRLENLGTESDTHIMALPVQVWPSHGQFANWCAILTQAADLIEWAEQAHFALQGAEVLAECLADRIANEAGRDAHARARFMENNNNVLAIKDALEAWKPE